MVFMPAETTGKNRKLSLPYYGPYRILEGGTNTLLVRPVDKPAEQAIRINWASEASPTLGCSIEISRDI